MQKVYIGTTTWRHSQNEQIGQVVKHIKKILGFLSEFPVSIAHSFCQLDVLWACCLYLADLCQKFHVLPRITAWCCLLWNETWGCIRIPWQAYHWVRSDRVHPNQANPEHTKDGKERKTKHALLTTQISQTRTNTRRSKHTQTTQTHVTPWTHQCRVLLWILVGMPLAWRGQENAQAKRLQSVFPPQCQIRMNSFGTRVDRPTSEPLVCQRKGTKQDILPGGSFIALPGSVYAQGRATAWPGTFQAKEPTHPQGEHPLLCQLQVFLHWRSVRICASWRVVGSLPVVCFCPLQRCEKKLSKHSTDVFQLNSTIYTATVIWCHQINSFATVQREYECMQKTMKTPSKTLHASMFRFYFCTRKTKGEREYTCRLETKTLFMPAFLPLAVISTRSWAEASRQARAGRGRLVLECPVVRARSAG